MAAAEEKLLAEQEDGELRAPRAAAPKGKGRGAAKAKGKAKAKSRAAAGEGAEGSPGVDSKAEKLKELFKQAKATKNTYGSCVVQCGSLRRQLSSVTAAYRRK